MAQFLNPAHYWLPLGILAFAFAIFNLIRAASGKTRGWEILLFLSLTCGALSLLAEYLMVEQWVQRGDWSALSDVVPGMSTILTSCSFSGILLNAAAWLLHIRHRKKE